MCASDKFPGGQGGCLPVQILSSFQSAPTLGLKAVWSWSYFKTTRDKVVDIFFQATGCPSSAAFELFEGSRCSSEKHIPVMIITIRHLSGHGWSNPIKHKTQTNGPGACKPRVWITTEPAPGRWGRSDLRREDTLGAPEARVVMCLRETWASGSSEQLIKVTPVLEFHGT